MSWFKRQGSSDLKITPRCRAIMAEAITVPCNSKMTFIPMSNVEYDTDNMHTSDATKFQINTPGLYSIVHQEYLTSIAKWTLDTATSVNVCIMKNGTEFIADMQPSIDGNVSALVYLNKGDYIQPLIFLQNTDTDMTFGFGDTWHPYISIAKVGD